MDRHTPPSLADDVAAALSWWRDAGVDLAYEDEARSWLADEEPSPAPSPSLLPPLAEAESPPMIGGDQAAWPGDLAAFNGWWLTEPSLEIGGLHGRIAPRGPARPPLMIVVPMPEPDDTDMLLSGPQGRLLSAIMRACGLEVSSVYLASALPRHAVLPDWQSLAAQGLGDLLRHHISLVDPGRVLVLGRDVLPLLEHNPAQGAPPVKDIAIQSRQVPLLISYAPGRLLEHSRLRAEFWRRWLDWTGTTGA